MEKKPKIVLVWLRRDLRLEDNQALAEAIRQAEITEAKVLPLFIFDTNILDSLKDRKDKRVTFIYNRIADLHQKLTQMGSTLNVAVGDPLKVLNELIQFYSIAAVVTAEDYEPYAIKRDQAVADVLKSHSIPFHSITDQVIFRPGKVLKADSTPYTVFTPYANKWKALLTPEDLIGAAPVYDLTKLKSCLFLLPFPTFSSTTSSTSTSTSTSTTSTSASASAPTPSSSNSTDSYSMPSFSQLGFEKAVTIWPEVNLTSNLLKDYGSNRDYPALQGTSQISLSLRFGLLSIRQLVKLALNTSEVWLNELIWREFFMQILYYYPQVVTQSFKPAYDRIVWRNDEFEFMRWTAGTTGFPLVDAGMRQLNETGLMHNRVRMVVASFLCKHLLIDWRLGEAYFAEKLLDYDLSANNGNWQWAAGTGCDAAPYFRIFNPYEQQKKFDPNFEYIKKWVPEYGTNKYAPPMVEHTFARASALKIYKEGLG